MALFDYKNLDSSSSADLMQTTKSLAVYGNISGILGLPTENILQKLASTTLSNGVYANKVDLSLPNGWSEVIPIQLDMPEDSLDSWGFYPIKSPLTGFTESGPQAKVLEHRDESGKIDQLSVVFAGTNSPVDVIDYFQINKNTIAPNMNPLLEAVKAYAIENQLSGEDVIITGYSLGGGMTNIMAKNRADLADGFYINSKYVGHESPYIFDDSEVIINMGYENDVVYRIIGNEGSIADAIKAGKPGLVNSDSMFTSTVDNIVLVNDVYASKLWGISPFSILNIPLGWSAHISGLMTDAVTRISNSTFYDFTSQDSTVIVSNLSSITRNNIWVSDKAAPTSDHCGKTAFIIGTEFDDLLSGGIVSDYIDAGAGDDKIKFSAGADRIDGGEGNDVLILNGSSQDWQFYQINDHEYFVNAVDNTGITHINNIEHIQFADDKEAHSIGNMTLSEATKGSDANDVLTGDVVFGFAGDDQLESNELGSLLHGGEGNDTLISNHGYDVLYGGEGNDTLYANGGFNVLSGGIGDDTFVIGAQSAQTIITDFNSEIGDNDKLLFSSEIFSDTSALEDIMIERDGNTYIQYDNSMVLVENTAIDDLIAHCSIIY